MHEGDSPILPVITRRVSTLSEEGQRPATASISMLHFSAHIEVGRHTFRTCESRARNVILSETCIPAYVVLNDMNFLSVFSVSVSASEDTNTPSNGGHGHSLPLNHAHEHPARYVLQTLQSRCQPSIGHPARKNRPTCGAQTAQQIPTQNVITKAWNETRFQDSFLPLHSLVHSNLHPVNLTACRTNCYRVVICRKDGVLDTDGGTGTHSVGRNEWRG